jgi:hypothetical protein
MQIKKLKFKNIFKTQKKKTIKTRLASYPNWAKINSWVWCLNKKIRSKPS